MSKPMIYYIELVLISILIFICSQVWIKYIDTKIDHGDVKIPLTFTFVIIILLYYLFGNGRHELFGSFVYNNLKQDKEEKNV